LLSNKAVVGIGMLIIFISTILVSAIAAGVIIRSSGLLQTRALEVEASTRERLINRVEVVSIYAVVNSTLDQVTGFEILTRLGAGSYEINLESMGINFLSETSHLELSYTTNLTDCTNEYAEAETGYCFDRVFGNSNSILEDGDVIKIKFWFNSTNYLSPDEDFQLSFIPQDGSVVDWYLSTPKTLNKPLVPIRI